jgi:hypothetical protein
MCGETRIDARDDCESAQPLGNRGHPQYPRRNLTVRIG